jgi:hypothetical protein
VPLDPAELALGAQEARHAPALTHVPVPPARHPRRDPPRHRGGRLDGIGRFQAVPPSSSREKARQVERPDGRDHPLHFSTKIGTTSQESRRPAPSRRPAGPAGDSAPSHRPGWRPDPGAAPLTGDRRSG